MSEVRKEMKTIRELKREKFRIIIEKKRIHKETVDIICNMIDIILQYRNEFNLKHKNDIISFKKDGVVIRGIVYTKRSKGNYLMNGDNIPDIQYDNLEKKKIDLICTIKILNEEQECKLENLRIKNSLAQLSNTEISRVLKLKKD